MIDSNTMTETMDTISSEVSTQESVIDKKKKSRKKVNEQTDVVAIDSQNVTSDILENPIDAVKPNKKSGANICSGTKIKAPVRFSVFETSVSSRPSKYVKGEYFIYSDDIIAGRIRITDSFSNIGMPNKYIGWANINEISKYVKVV